MTMGTYRLQVSPELVQLVSDNCPTTTSIEVEVGTGTHLGDDEDLVGRGVVRIGVNQVFWGAIALDDDTIIHLTPEDARELASQLIMAAEEGEEMITAMLAEKERKAKQAAERAAEGSTYVR